CLFWGLVTALLAAWGWFALLLVITGLIAVAQAIPATLFLLRYRWLRGEPLPAQRPVNARRSPPPSSAARSAMLALGASERGFFSLLGVMERGNMLPAAEIRDLTAAANQTAAAMAATATEVVSMERAVNATPQSRSYLVPTINAFTAQLSAGVRQYNEMVTAAAQLVSSANSQPAGSGPALPAARQRYRDELVGATDRLLGWAQAFDELGGLPGA
ncbi:MAG: phage shock envelope stress response protein PspM, partial [Mycobacterium sp.]